MWTKVTVNIVVLMLATSTTNTDSTTFALHRSIRTTTTTKSSPTITNRTNLQQHNKSMDRVIFPFSYYFHHFPLVDNNRRKKIVFGPNHAIFDHQDIHGKTIISTARNVTEIIQIVMILSSTCFDSTSRTRNRNGHCTTTTRDESVWNVMHDCPTIVHETFVSEEPTTYIASSNDTTYINNSRMQHQRQRIRKRLRIPNCIATMQFLPMAMVSFLQNNLFTFLVGLVPWQILQLVKEQQLRQHCQVWKDVLVQWMTTIRHYIQQLWNYHDKVIAHMSLYIYEQIVDDTMKQYRNSGSNVKKIHKCMETTRDAVTTTDTKKQTSDIRTSNYDHKGNTTYSLDVTVVDDVIVDNHRSNDSVSSSPNSSATISDTTTMVVAPFCHHDMPSILSGSTATTTSLDSSFALDHVKNSSSCNTTTDWNDTIAAFILRLTMIAVMCYLIAISQ